MSKLTDRASYLLGLAEGMKLNTEKDSNRLLLELIELTSDMAKELEELSQAHDELDDYVESIDDDLAQLEETLFDDDDDDEDEDENEEDGEEDGDVTISYACPHCGEDLTFKASEIDFEKEYLCPSCGKSVFPETEESDEDEIEDPDKE